LPLFIKGLEVFFFLLFAFGFYFGFWKVFGALAFALGFFGVGSFWKGKELLKGKKYG
jgi:hypothetical protein